MPLLPPAEIFHSRVSSKLVYSDRVTISPPGPVRVPGPVSLRLEPGRALGLLGVGDAQVEAVSFGKEKPAATGTDEASMGKNRRAEINYR